MPCPLRALVQYRFAKSTRLLKIILKLPSLERIKSNCWSAGSYMAFCLFAVHLTTKGLRRRETRTLTA